MDIQEETHKYGDMMELPHHTSSRRPRMPMMDRAAQFSPFAALTGYDAAVKETARLTDQRIELDEYEKSRLDIKIQILLEHLPEKREVTFIYFRPDERKAGGAYEKKTGIIRKMDTYERKIILWDGTVIPIEDIYEMEEL